MSPSATDVTPRFAHHMATDGFSAQVWFGILSFHTLLPPVSEEV
jgi:hypothetical protein